MLAGQVMEGNTLLTVTVNDSVAVNPASLVAVHEMVLVPMGNE
jgi:hypothetical protein